MKQYRGVMSPISYNENDMVELKKWNANLIRWQINWFEPNFLHSPTKYLKELGLKMSEIGRLIESCSQKDIKICLDLHCTPGGTDEQGKVRVCSENKYLLTLVKAWKMLANQYKNSNLYAYDIVNEPVTIENPYISSRKMQIKLSKVIRKIDKTTPIIFEINYWINDADVQLLEPIPIENVIYSIHLYYPYEYTHQGINGNPNGISYPGIINGEYIDKEKIRKHLQNIRDFQLKNNVKIFIGEFSAIRYAKGAAQWLADVISIFDEYGWDWTYHAFREWYNWDVEYCNDKIEISDNQTDRKIELLKGLQKNS